MSHALDALRAIVEGLVGPRLDHLALYPCTVIAQRADGTLDLQPDAARVPACAGVPIRHGLPGVTVTVPAGGRVLLGYAGGNPDLPFAALWEPGTVTAITVNGGTAKAARDGEDVMSSTTMGAWITAVSTATGATPPTGAIGAVSGGSDALKLP